MANGIIQISERPWTLLWTNDSPSSNFAAQKVAINLTGYTEVRIVMLRNKDASDNIFGVFDITIEWMANHQYIVSGIVDMNSLLGRRIISAIDSTGVTFSEASKYTSYNSGLTADNGRLIPLYIYAR